jgi:hypothetical protein
MSSEEFNANFPLFSHQIESTTNNTSLLIKVPPDCTRMISNNTRDLSHTKYYIWEVNYTHAIGGVIMSKEKTTLTTDQLEEYPCIVGMVMTTESLRMYQLPL